MPTTVPPETTFTRALVRKPGQNFSAGITTAKLGKPDYQQSLEQHNRYCAALKQCGLKLIILNSDSAHPDAPFVEDAAVVAGESAIITHLGDGRRQGEGKRVAEELSNFFHFKTIQPPGTVDGGDVLKIGTHYYIGLSKRTNKIGATQLSDFLSSEGFTTSFIPVKGVLHLKTGITYIGNNTVVAIKQLASRDEFKKFKVITVDEDESYAANCLLINGRLLIPRGFPKLKSKLQKLGYKLTEVAMSEFEKMDGGLTCLSILF